MKLSIMLFPFNGLLKRGDITPAELCRRFAASGIRGLELFQAMQDETPGCVAELAACAKDLGLAFSCQDLSLNLLQPTAQDEQKTLSYGRRAIEFVKSSLGCSKVMIYGSRLPEGMDAATGRRLYGEKARELALFAKELGVELLLEDFGVYPRFVCTADQCLEVLNAAGGALHFTFDNGNFIYGGDSPRHAFPLLADVTRHVHLKDFRQLPWDGTGDRPGNVPGTVMQYGCYGDGVCDVAWCIRAFLERGYDQWFSLELGGPCDQLALADRAAAFCLAQERRQNS